MDQLIFRQQQFLLGSPSKGRFFFFDFLQLVLPFLEELPFSLPKHIFLLGNTGFFLVHRDEFFVVMLSVPFEHAVGSDEGLEV
jgi:hypothetical protein